MWGAVFNIFPNYPQHIQYDIGNSKLENIRPPDNLTRENWYKNLLENKEKRLKNLILEILDSDDNEFDYYKTKLENHLMNTDLYDKKSWKNNFELISNNLSDIKNPIYNKSKLNTKYKITKLDLFKIINNPQTLNKIQRHNLLPIISIEPLNNSIYNGISLFNQIAINNDNHNDINFFFILFHELSHFYNKDCLNSTIINIIMESRKTMCNENICMKIPESYLAYSIISLLLLGKSQSVIGKNLSDNGFSSKNLIIKKYDGKKYNDPLYVNKILDNLFEEYEKNKEIRADLESLFIIKNLQNFDKYNIFKYGNMRKCSVNYLEDYYNGYIKDIK
jgi:hypothetical protein